MLENTQKDESKRGLRDKSCGKVGVLKEKKAKLGDNCSHWRQLNAKY
jgi:hypothetical protein